MSKISEEKKRLYDLIVDVDNSETTNQLYLNELANLNAEQKKQHWMIIGEGLTFFLILTFGVFKLRKTFVKELQLADQQNNFLLSITHELKSPIASAQLNIETIGKRNLEENHKQLLLNNSLNDLSRLNNLVQKILLAAQMESGQMSINRMRVNISILFINVLDKYKINHSGRIQSRIEENIIINGDETLMNSVLVNLVDNALKYSVSEGPVVVDLSVEKSIANLQVSNKGKLIPEIEKKRIFEKFYRVGNEEVRTSIGTGLGLYLVKQIVELHHGKIGVSDDKVNKTTFCVEFPIA